MPKVEKERKNSARCTDNPYDWPAAVWELFEKKMEQNKTSKSKPYFVTAPLCPLPEIVPPALSAEQCHNPAGSNNVMVCYNGKEYQRPLHRIRFLLKIRKEGQLPNESKSMQASHLCPDDVNVDGKGAKHCCNPDHMVAEDDKTNKSRQRCAGWVWIHPHRGNDNGFWYPSCIHNPPCLRFVPKNLRPSQLDRM